MCDIGHLQLFSRKDSQVKMQISRHLFDVNGVTYNTLVGTFIFINP